MLKIDTACLVSYKSTFIYDLAKEIMISDVIFPPPRMSTVLIEFPKVFFQFEPFGNSHLWTQK